MNSVTLTGRLTDDPDTKTVAGDKTVTTFRLAVNRPGSDQVDFVSITCWNGVAKAAGEHLTKGRLVGIEGQLRHHEWTDRDGQRHSRLDVNAAIVEFLDPKR